MVFSEKVLLAELVMSIDRLMEAAKKAPIVEGEWTPAIVLGHISQVDEQVWLTRVQLMVDTQKAGGQEPKFAWWEPDPIATAEKFKDYDLELACAEALQARTKLVTYLNSLDPDQWDANATHATFGSLDVRELIFQTLSHDEEHRESFV
ncbi:MAG: hypothetical protein RLZZ571_206 [Actinomycetota bacterium]|jgi:hypothetical protein